MAHPYGSPGGGLEHLPETDFETQVEVPVRGKALVDALNELVGRLPGVTDQEGAVRRAISVLHQAMDRQIVLVDSNGRTTTVQGVWK